MMPATDLTEKRFGRLRVLHRDGSESRRAVWKCACDCGRDVRVKSTHLLRGSVKSCGCLQRAAKVHGAARRGKKIPEYYVWVEMHQRCENPKSKKYSDYGGRGIAVCASWSDFAEFIADMGPRPSERHTLDRADNSRGYSPDNCRWATRKEQASNTRRNIIVDICGERMTLMQAVERYRSRDEYNLIAHRYRSGWSLESLLGMDDQLRASLALSEETP